MSHDAPKDLIPLDPQDPALDEAEDNRQADQVEREIFGNEDNARQTTGIINRFVQSYERNKHARPLEDWLTDEFRLYPNIWRDEEELNATAREIIVTVRDSNANKESLYAHLDAGKSRETWLAKKIEQGAEAAGVTQVGRYAGQIDQALEEATASMEFMVTTKNSEIKQSQYLHGFIAEAELANLFNIDATTLGSDYKARVFGSQELDSVDIIINKPGGMDALNIQVKSYANVDTLIQNIRGHNYAEGTVLMVHDNQVARIQQEFPHLKVTSELTIDGVNVPMPPYEELKQQQIKVQQEREIKEYAWNDVNRVNVAKQISKQALIGACIGAGLQGARILGRRAWNWLQGRENPPASEDLQEFFHDSIKGAKHIGVQVAVSGGVVVAVKNGLLGQVLKNTPAGRITSAVYIGMENARILFKLAKGELSGPEALDAMGVTSSSALGGLAGAGLGMTKGAALGAVFGPLGVAVGGFVGGVVGGMAGSTIGDALYQGGKVVVKTAAKVLNTLTEGFKEAAATVARNLNPLNWFA